MADVVGLLVEPLIVLRPLDECDPRQVVEEHRPRPAAHFVRARRPEVPIDDDDRADDGDDVHDEGEEEVLGDERDVDGGGGEDLGDEEEEDDEGKQDGYTHRHLLSSVSLVAIIHRGHAVYFNN